MDFIGGLCGTLFASLLGAGEAVVEAPVVRRGGGGWLLPRRPTKSELEAALMVVLLAEEADE